MKARWEILVSTAMVLHLILPVLTWCPYEECICDSDVNGKLEIYCPKDQYARRIKIDLRPKEKISVKCEASAMAADWAMLDGLQMDPVRIVKIELCPVPPLNFTRYINVTQATYLTYSSYKNLTEGIPPQLFHQMTHLETLDLQGNSLRQLPENLLDGLTALKRLYLHKNQLEDLPLGFLKNAPNLKVLEVGSNRLRGFEPGLWENASNLNRLNVWSNQLEVLDPSIFAGLSNLTELDISINKLTSLDSDAFKELSGLKSINLSKNPLSNLARDLFQWTPDLQFLRLTNNLAKLSLPAGFLAGLAKLEKVDLSRSGMESLPEDLFAGSHALMVISLKSNGITQLPAVLFEGLASLDTLDLSENFISEIPVGLFQSLSNLTELNLSYNRLTVIGQKAFFGLRNLKVLNMEENGLRVIHDGAFYHVPNLRDAQLSHNFITGHGEGAIKDFNGGNSVFRHCLYLETLELANNSISEIFTDWQLVFLNLSKLDLSFNNVTYLLGMDLQFLSKGVEVDLQYNYIAFVAELVVLGVNEPKPGEKVPNVLLSHNPIECGCRSYDLGRYVHTQLPSPVYGHLVLRMDELECASPPNLRGRSVKDVMLPEYLCWEEAWDCPNRCRCNYRKWDNALLVDCSNQGLVKAPMRLPEVSISNHTLLWLENNNLTAGPNMTGPGFEKVTHLFLSHNHITDVTPDMTNPKLKTVMLDNNRLSRIGNGTLNRLAEAILDAVSLYGNPWQCDCASRDLLNWIQAHNKKIVDLNKIMCSDKRLLSKLSIDEICTGPVNILITMTLLAGLGVLVAVCAALYYRFEYDVKVWLFAHKWCLCLVTEDELDRDKRFDAFVSFSHKDEQFVVEELVPRLEASGLTLCLHYRDWVAGEWIPNQIARSVDASRRTLVVLSPSFIESVWGRMEFRSAHKQALSEGRARVVMLVYGDVPPKEQLDPELKSYITMNTYVKWGDPWFWDKLRYALPHAPLPLKKSKKCGERIELTHPGLSPANTPTTPVTNGLPVFPVLDPPISNNNGTAVPS